MLKQIEEPNYEIVCDSCGTAVPKQELPADWNSFTNIPCDLCEKCSQTPAAEVLGKIGAPPSE